MATDAAGRQTGNQKVDTLDTTLAEAMSAFEAACFWAKAIQTGDVFADEQSRAWKKDAQKLLVRAKAIARRRAKRLLGPDGLRRRPADTKSAGQP